MMTEISEQNNTTIEWHAEESAAKSEQMTPPWNARDGDGESMAADIDDRTKKWRWIKPGDPDEPAVDPDLSSTLQTQTELDRMLMKSSIKKYGVMDSVKVWAGKWVIVDGHNRVRICKELGIPYPVEEIEFADIDAAKEWMEKQQLGRRNLSTFSRCEMVIDHEPEIREEALKRMHAGKKHTVAYPVEIFPQGQGKTRDIVAGMIGISGKTYQKVKWLVENADKDTLELLRIDTVSIDKGLKATKWFLNDIDEFTKHRIERGETTVIEAYDVMRRAAKKSANEECDEDDYVEYEDDAPEAEDTDYEDDSEDDSDYEDDVEDDSDEASQDAGSNVISILPYLKRRNQGMAGTGYQQGSYQNNLGSANPHPMLKPQSPTKPKPSNSECKIISILPYLDNPNWDEEEEEERRNSRDREAAARYEDEHDRYDDLPDPDPRFARHVKIEDIKVSRPTKEQLARRYANDDGEEDPDGLAAGSNENLAISDLDELARALRERTDQYVAQVTSLLTAFKCDAMTEDDRARLPAILDDCLNTILDNFAEV